MGLLDRLLHRRIANPVLTAAIETYCAGSSEDHLVELWQCFLKSKVILASTIEGVKSFGKAKHTRDVMGISCHSIVNTHGDNLLAVYVDSDKFEALMPSASAALTLTGAQAYELASGKGMLGLCLNPKGTPTCELKVWQHQIFIERISDANKLQALGAKLSRAGNYADAEGVLKGAIFAAQREPGAQHPYSAELNVDLARVQRMQGKQQDCEWTFRRALGIYEASGKGDLDVANTAEELGSLLCELKKTDQATPFLQHAMQIYERVPGGKPDSIARILVQLGEIKCEEGHLDEGEANFRRAAVKLEERKHPDLLGVLNKIGGLCARAGRTKEAIATYMRAVTAFEAIRRCKETDMAHAAQQAGSLNIELGKYADARPLLEKALQAYRRDGTEEDLELVGNLLKKLGEEEQHEADDKEEQTHNSASESEGLLEGSGERRAAGGRPGYGRASKRPPDLPLLDMSAMKATPKAALGGAAFGKPIAPEPVHDPEEQALEQMRAFLDSIDQEAPPAAKEPSPEWQTTTPPAEPESPALNEKEVADIVKIAIRAHDEISSAEEASPVFAAPQNIAPAAAVFEETQPIRHDDSEASGLDDLFGGKREVEENPVAPQAVARESAPPEAQAPSTLSEEEEPSAQALSEPALAEPAPTVEAESSPAPKMEPADTTAHAAPAPPPVAPPPPPPPAPRDVHGSAKVSSNAKDTDDGHLPPASPPGDDPAPKGKLGASLAADISGIFRKSMVDRVADHDRFDKPIAERLNMASAAPGDAEAESGLSGHTASAPPESPAQSPPQLDPVETKAEAPAATPAAPSLFDGSISMVFDRAMLGDLDRFEKQIGQREEELPKDSGGVPGNELDSSLNDAFNKLVGDNKEGGKADRFDKPISERSSMPTEPAPLQPPAAPPSPTAKAPPPSPPSPSVPSPTAAAAQAAGDNPMAMLGQLKARLSSAKDQLSQAESKLESSGSIEAEQAQAAIAHSAAPAQPAQPIDLSSARTPEELLSMLEQKLTGDPNNIELLMRKGTVLAQQQKIGDAIKVFDKVTTLKPGDAKAWYCKGSSLHLKSDYEDALYCFNHVLNLDSENVKAMLRKAECLIKLGRTDQGMMLYERMLAIRPEFIAGWLSKARALLQQRRFADALECYEQVLIIDATNEEANKAKKLIATRLGAAQTT